MTDRTDPQLVHLDGLNLSRAWCMRSIAGALPAGDPARAALAVSAARHAEAALEHVASGDYAGEHWLASFAVYPALDPGGGVKHCGISFVVADTPFKVRRMTAQQSILTDGITTRR